MTLNRRTVLKGLFGSTIALPMLEAMVGSRAAQAQAASAKRLMLVHWPQGVPTGWAPLSSGPWFPAAAGPLPATMPECLQPLAPHRADLNIVSGLTYAPYKNSFDSHGHAIAVFTGYAADGNTKASRGASVDQIAGRAIGAATRFSSLAAACYDNNEGWWSWSAPGVRSPMELNPQSLFNRLFGTTSQPPSQGEVQARRAKSILDAVKSEANDLNRKLGAADRQRLDNHLSSIRELEKAVATPPMMPPGNTCTAPANPGQVNYGDGDFVRYVRTMIDVLVMAHRCDLTRVSLLSFGGVWMSFPHIGITTDYHNVCHEGFNDTASKGPRLDRQAAALAYRKIATHFMEQIAYYLSALKVPDATGATLLDSTAFVALSEFGDGGLHYESYIPVIVAGKAGKTGTAAMATGQNLAYPCDFGQSFTNAGFCAGLSGPKNRTLNDLWTSTLRATGVLGATQTFGDPALSTQPLPGLWT